MKSTFAFIGVLVGFVVGSVSPLFAVTFDSVDRSLSIIQTTEPSVKPKIGEILPAFGMVRMLITIDASGKLEDSMLVDYDDQRFADAAVEAVRKWHYEPARQNGAPIGVRTMLVFNFETRGQVVSMTGCDSVMAFIKNFSSAQPVRRVCRPSELDVIPKPIVVVSPSPVMPSEMAAMIDNVLVAAIVITPTATKAVNAPSENKGVLVDFFIDEAGHPRMLTVNSRCNELMASAAVEALEQWRFSPPTMKGVPVAVRAQQWFDFSKTVVAQK